MSDLLFHYCPTQSFHSIITGASIWLSSLSASNDSLEGRLVGKLLLNRLKDAKLDINQFNEAQKLILKSFEMSIGLGFCLSTECDRLSQWRGYADDGRGFAIGFSKSYLESEFTSRSNLHEAPITLCEVVYEDSEASESNFLDEIFKILMKAVGNKNNTKIDHIIEFINRHYTFKNNAFEEESEWRLLTYYLNKQNNNFVQYRPSGNQLIPYLPLELHNQNKAISKVVLGPKNVTPKPIVEMFLSKFMFGDVEIIKSNATYR